MGTSTQRDVFNETTASPGPKYIYQKKPTETTKSYKFASDRKMKSPRSITPGPGNYETKTPFGKEGKKNTMGMRTEEINSSKYNPGVGSYNVAERNKPKAKGYKIMDGKKEEVFKPKDPDNPGPGLYTPSKVDKSKQPQWTMGAHTPATSLHGKNQKSHGDKPAPGQYDHNKSLKDGPKVRNKLIYY